MEAFSGPRGRFLSDLGYEDRSPVTFESVLWYWFVTDETRFRNLLAVDFCNSDLICWSVRSFPFYWYLICRIWFSGCLGIVI